MSPLSYANISTEHWTLNLVVNNKGVLHEKIYTYETRKKCYDDIFLKINQTKKEGKGAAGICLKLFIDGEIADSESDKLKIFSQNKRN